MKKQVIMNLMNAKELNQKHPKTFQIPSQEELDKVKVTDIVKVEVYDERFWVIVKKIKDGEYLCTIDNDLVRTDTHGLNYKDNITINQEHILGIYAG